MNRLSYRYASNGFQSHRALQNNLSQRRPGGQARRQLGESICCISTTPRRVMGGWGRERVSREYAQNTHKAFTKRSQSFHAHSHTNLTTSPCGAWQNCSTENPRARPRKSDPAGLFPRTHLHEPERGGKGREQEKKNQKKRVRMMITKSLS